MSALTLLRWFRESKQFNPKSIEACFLFTFEVWADNSGKSFDAEFFKPLVLIHIFIMNMRM